MIDAATQSAIGIIMFIGILGGITTTMYGIHAALAEGRMAHLITLAIGLIMTWVGFTILIWTIEGAQ